MQKYFRLFSAVVAKCDTICTELNRMPKPINDEEERKRMLSCFNEDEQKEMIRETVTGIGQLNGRLFSANEVAFFSGKRLQMSIGSDLPSDFFCTFLLFFKLYSTFF